MTRNIKLVVACIATGAVVPALAIVVLSCEVSPQSESQTSNDDAPDSPSAGTGVMPDSQGTGGRIDPVESQGDCPLPEFETPAPVPVSLEQTLDLTLRGGEISAGTYVLKQALRAEQDGPGEEPEFVMRFDLEDGGVGYYTRQLGFRVYTSKISWSTEGNTFTYQTLCPDTLETLSFGYSADSGQLVLVLLLETETVLVFDKT